MIYLFIDTNIVIDFIADRKPFSKSAVSLFDYSEKGKVRIFISSLSYSHIYYVVKKAVGHKEMIEILRDLESISETVDVTKAIIKSALSSDFKDFEDAIQFYTAISNKKITAIVTRDTKGFKSGDLTVMTPEEAVSLVENAIG